MPIFQGKCCKSFNPPLTGGAYNEINNTRRPKVTVALLRDKAAFNWNLREIFNTPDFCQGDKPNQPA